MTLMLNIDFFRKDPIINKTFLPSSLRVPLIRLHLASKNVHLIIHTLIWPIQCLVSPQLISFKITIKT